MNTYLSITASVTTACFWSRVHFGKLDMEIVLNATIAGGVVIIAYKIIIIINLYKLLKKFKSNIIKQNNFIHFISILNFNRFSFFYK